MENPDLYNKFNSLARACATDCLNEYAQKIKWKKSGDSIVDVGCGDGSVTAILKKYLLSNCAKFVACDINEKMIAYAEKYCNDEEITFRMLDIEGTIPDDLRYGFNHVFSFLLFHWVQNQEKAFENIYNLMSPGGDCLLTFFAYKPVTYIYDIIARDPNMNWGSVWFKDIRKFVSVYCHMEKPVNYVTDILKNIGFINIDVQCKRKRYVFKNIIELKELLRAVDPFGMPAKVFDDFFNDFVAVGRDNGIFDKTTTDLDDRTEEVPYDYELLIVHATKPENLFIDQ